MAYIDKCTRMRRFALIDDYNGNINYEGVWIEGIWIFKNISDGGLISTPYDPTIHSDFSGMVTVYEDKEKDIIDFWIPRQECEKDAYGRLCYKEKVAHESKA